MERESNQMQSPTLCRAGCGFYGSPSSEGMCSLCYKEALKKKQQPPNPSLTPASSSGVVNNILTGRCSPPSSVPVVGNTAAQAAAVTLSANTSIIGTSSNSVPSGACAPPVTNMPPTPLDVSTAQPTVSIAGSPAPNVASPKDTGSELRQDVSGASSSTSESCDLDSSQDSSQDNDGGKRKKNRCLTCHKKVGLTGFECRCGGLFCAVHRYSDKHNCTFNYRELGAEEIRRNNPVIVGEKIKKI